MDVMLFETLASQAARHAFSKDEDVVKTINWSIDEIHRHIGNAITGDPEELDEALERAFTVHLTNLFYYSAYRLWVGRDYPWAEGFNDPEKVFGTPLHKWLNTACYTLCHADNNNPNSVVGTSIAQVHKYLKRCHREKIAPDLSKPKNIYDYQHLYHQAYTTCRTVVDEVWKMAHVWAVIAEQVVDNPHPYALAHSVLTPVSEQIAG